MTRMWGIDPRSLCDAHLLGEHAELHQLVGIIEKHPHGMAMLRGYAERAQIDTRRIQSRHDSLAEELARREFTHDSPLSYTDELALGSIDREKNRLELAARCPACRARIETESDCT